MMIRQEMSGVEVMEGSHRRSDVTIEVFLAMELKWHVWNWSSRVLQGPRRCITIGYTYKVKNYRTVE